ncbi:MAG: patatin family protein [Roseburia sp.]|nr:patatin family protein [Roseburia sp.]
MKTGVIDVGGGLRGVYAAGVFDYCLDAEIEFDLGIGVSAGSANVASYAARQRGRNYTFYTEYPFRKEYMSVRNLLFKKSYLDLDYIYGTLSNGDGENPLDYQKLVDSSTEFMAVATDAKTGEAKYFGKSDLAQDDYSVLKASCAIPLVCHPYEVQGTAYYDGGLGDTVPIEKAFECGCDKVVLILTKPRDLVRTSNKDRLFADRLQRKYPMSAERLRQRSEQYNHGVALAKEYEARGQALIIAPDDTCGVDTLTKNKEALKAFYEKGYEDAKTVEAFLAG